MSRNRLRKVTTDAEATDLGRREEAHDDIDPVVVIIITIVIMFVVVVVVVGIGMLNDSVWIFDVVAELELGYMACQLEWKQEEREQGGWAVCRGNMLP